MASISPISAGRTEVHIAGIAGAAISLAGLTDTIHTTFLSETCSAQAQETERNFLEPVLLFGQRFIAGIVGAAMFFADLTYGIQAAFLFSDSTSSSHGNRKRNLYSFQRCLASSTDIHALLAKFE